MREVAVCKDGVWTSDTPCKTSERCDSTQGVCAPVAAVCSGQEAGSLFCDGDKRLVCDDLVSARELPCDANELCSRKDGRVSCACAPGAGPATQGKGCEFVAGCSDSSGCDPLTRCMPSGSNAFTCTECPPDHIGDGRKGCAPLLQALSLTCSTGNFTRSIELTRGVYDYRITVPMLCQSVTLTATGSEGAQLELDGLKLEAGGSWSSSLLHVGDNPFKVVLTAQSSRSSSYQLEIERTGSKVDYLKASNSRADASFGFGLAAEGNRLLVGAPFETSNGSSGEDTSVRNAGAAYLFELEGDKWVEKQLIKADSPREGDMFGASVAIAGDLMVVGAPRYNLMLFKVVPPSEPGRAHVYSRDSATSRWKHEKELTPTEGSGADMFGFRVAVHGDTVLVGAPYDSTSGSQAGAVYSFVRSQGSWSEPQKIVASTATPEASLGVSMAIQGDLMVAGAMQDSTAAEAAGSAYVFARTAGEWREQERLQAPSPKALATFGTAVALHTGRIVVTAPGLDLRQRPTPAGEAFLFERAAGSGKWEVTGKYHAAVPRSVDLFGGSLAVNSFAIIVGANGDASSSRGIDGDPGRSDAPLAGAAYVFGLQGSEYVQSAYLKAFNAEADDSFGHGSAATDSFVAVGAPFESSGQRNASSQDDSSGLDDSARASGAVYVYR